ncbi:MAG: alpha/beta fold hydrolase [Rubrobacter sp.]
MSTGSERTSNFTPAVLETSLHLLEHLPQVQLHIFGQCSHWTMIEYKNAFNELLLDFFGGTLNG